MKLYGFGGGYEGLSTSSALFLLFFPRLAETLSYGVFDVDECGSERNPLRQFCLAPDRNQAAREFYETTAVNY